MMNSGANNTRPEAPKWYYLKYFTQEANLYRQDVERYIRTRSNHIELNKYSLDKKCSYIVATIIFFLTTIMTLIPYFPEIFNPRWFGLGSSYTWTDKIVFFFIPPVGAGTLKIATFIPKIGRGIKIINRLILMLIIIITVIKKALENHWHKNHCEKCIKNNTTESRKLYLDAKKVRKLKKRTENDKKSTQNDKNSTQNDKKRTENEKNKSELNS